MARIWMPLPDTDFDVTEVAVPWKLLTDAGHTVHFSTENGGKAPTCDPLLLTGVLFGQLGAEPEPKRFYGEMQQSDTFKSPLSWMTLDPSDFDALWLPGGHAPGMRQYLGNIQLQQKVFSFFESGRPVAAICHGVLVAARSGALRGRKTTCLPRYMELSAWLITSWKLGNYYRTYPITVEEEVRSSLSHPDDFLRGPVHLFSRGTADNDGPAFVVNDGAYFSARWPGDAYRLSRVLIESLSQRSGMR